MTVNQVMLAVSCNSAEARHFFSMFKHLHSDADPNQPPAVSNLLLLFIRRLSAVSLIHM